MKYKEGKKNQRGRFYAGLRARFSKAGFFLTPGDGRTAHARSLKQKNAKMHYGKTLSARNIVNYENWARFLDPMLDEKLKDDLKNALREGDAKRVSTLRMLRAAIKNKEIEERKKDVGLGDEELILIIQKEVKKRKDSISEFERGGRNDLALAEACELKILEKYLPAELSDAEVIRIIEDGIRELGSRDQSKFGGLMKIIMPTLKGKASGDRITKFAKEALNKSE